MTRILRLGDDGEHVAEQPAATSTGASDAGKVPVLGPDGKLDASLYTVRDLYYEHVQATPSAEWVVDHGLGKFPSVTAFDSAGDQVVGEVWHNPNRMQTILRFGAPFSGTATFN